MSRLIGMITRVAVWGASGGVAGLVLVFLYELGFKGGALNFTSPNAMTGAGAGAVIGGVVGFFRRS